MLLHFQIVRFPCTKRAVQHTVTALLFLATVRTTQAQSTPDFPLIHKDASEITVRFTEPVMDGESVLLSTAAFRYGVVLTDLFGKGPLRGTLEYTLDWLPAIVMTKPTVVYGAGVAPFGLKWNFVGRPRLRPYGELVLGGVLSTNNIPPGDTLNINFTINAGGGLTLLTRGNQSLTAGLDFSHLSNGNLGAHNPQLNGFAFVLEYHWMKR
jgi:lipid A 3-O-deacylase PagL